MKKRAISVLLLLIVLFTLGSSAQIFPKHLYVYWHTPMETAPLLIQLCVQRMQIACNESNWNFTVLNDTNLKDHLPNYYEKYLPVANAAKHPGWKASVADLIRLAIIEQKGGMYLDISTFLFRGLGWLERLEDFQYLLTNSEIHTGKFPDVLQSYFTHYQNIVQSRHPDHGITNIEPGYESWCFIAKPKASYITALRNRHAHHYTNTEWDNKVEDFEKDYYLRGVFSDYLNNQKSAYQVIQETQFQLDKNLTLFGQRKNVNHHFNLVGFRAEYGPFPFLINLVAMQRAYTHTLDQIYEQDKIPLFFFMKMTSQDRPFIEGQLSRNVELTQRYDNISKNFETFLQSMPSEDDCRNLKLIVEGSVMGHVVSKSKIAKEKKLSPISLEQRQRWWDYCKRVHNVEQNPGLSPDGRVSQIFNQLVMPIAQFLLPQSSTNKLRQLLNQIAILCAYSNHGYYGGFSDVQQTYYWRKVFEKRNPHILNPTPNPDDQYVKTRPLDDYSFFEEIELRLRLYVSANKTTFAYKLKFFIFFLTFTCILAVLFFSITMIVKVGLPVCKFIRLLFTKQQDERSAYFASIKQKTETISNYMQRLCQNINVDSVSKFCTWFAPVAIKYLVKRMLIRLLCLAYIAYNAIIAFQFYYVVYFGKIYYQEFAFLMFIVIQILFRKAFQKIGHDQWALPGLTLGQLHRIFVPVYIFSLGASIVNMAERTEVRNLALSTSLCMILPVLIKEVDLQLKKLYKLWHLDQIPKSIQIPQVKMTVEFILKILLNLSNSVEIVNMIFLGINVFLPNLRFIVHNNEMYAVKKFFHSLEGLVQFFFVTLVILYLAELWKKIQQNGQDTKRSQFGAGRQSLNSETQMKKMSRSSFEKHSLSDDLGSRTDRIDQKNNSNKLSRFFTIFLEFIFYSFKIWIFYGLAYTKWSEILIRNTFNIAYSQQLPGMEWYTTALKIMAILIIFFVSWELQKVIEQLIMKISAKGKGTSECKSSSYIDLKEDTEQNMSTIFKKSKKTQKTNTMMMNWSVLVGLTLLLIPQYKLFNTIHTYLMAIDQKNWDLKGSFEGEFYNLMQVTWILTTCSFKFIKQIISNWSSANLKHDGKSQIQGQKNDYSPIGSPTTECLNGQNSKEQTEH